jgi:protein phosphatase 2C family protein 2/3
VITAIYKGFETAEKEYFLENKPKNLLSDFNRSGSCALVVIIVEDICYIANLGDSRAILSENYGTRIQSLSRDHKPNEEFEKQRIVSNGGHTYQGVHNNVIDLTIPAIDYSRLPCRIFPGKLSVIF